MKQKITIGSCLLISALTTNSNAAVVTSPAMPTGTLNIAGKIIDKGCTFEAKDFVIQLTPVVISTFTAVGDQGPKSDPVDFKLTGCPANTPPDLYDSGCYGGFSDAFRYCNRKHQCNGFRFCFIWTIHDYFSYSSKYSSHINT